MRYYSKRDWWLGLVLWVPILAALAATGYEVVNTGRAVAAFVMVLLTTLFAAWIWFGTYYLMEDKYLIVRTGPFRERIPYGKIVSIKEVRNPLSSAALSMDRIRIRYGKAGYTLISPEDKETFIKEIEGKCPGRIVERRKT